MNSRPVKNAESRSVRIVERNPDTRIGARKKTLPVVQSTGSENAISDALNLFYGNGVLFANFDAALATQTLFAVDDS